MEAQSLAVKRAQVEFHNFASLGQPDVVLADYAQDNERRGGILRKHLDFIGPLTPFLEIGANAGHSSYLLANDFDANGFALDISADALRHGMYLMDAWNLSRSPVRIAGDAVRLPFQDGSLRFVMACQMLSQFLDLDAVFREVARVLQPGGIFFFTEEPIRRLATLRLFRAPYEEQMKGWEKTLHRAGLLGYLVRDVIGAQQEEGFGIRQNHTLYLKDWHALVFRHFSDARFEIFPPRRGWGEGIVHSLLAGNTWRAARLLGGTLSGICKKAGSAAPPVWGPFEPLLRCPDCGASLHRQPDEALTCSACPYRAPFEGGVFNLLPSEDKKELYPGRRSDILDFSEPGHESQLDAGFHELEGVFGNKYRWVTGRPRFHLVRVGEGPAKLRLRGHAPEGHRFRIELRVNGELLHRHALDRNGLFVLEDPLPDAPRYDIELLITPSWQAPNDDRELTLTLSLARLIPA
jgi:SAM-dependent methyltransferase